jgi:hypothetical protein
MLAQEFFDSVVAQSKANYHRYHTFDHEVGGKGEVEFHMVGHNASHEFAIAMMDDKLVTYSAGEGFCGCEGYCDCIQPIDVHVMIRESFNPNMSLGHW